MSPGLTADELTDQLKTLRADLREENIEDYFGAELITKEFFNLRLPVESEVLDVAAGRGLVSANLQTRGFANIDALDEDLPTLRTLQALRLYREYIWRGVTGLNSTGLREETYDVIVTAGGICSNGISPTHITEMLRLLKSDGHLLLTMKTVSGEASSEFGLFDINLASIEKEGKCQLMKKEVVVDSGSIPLGVFYLIRKCPGHLPDYLGQDIAKDLPEIVTELLEDTSDLETRVKFYDAWSAKYDEDLVVIGNYTGHIKCAEAFHKLGLGRNVQILDVAAGTGLLGAEVAKLGYHNVDALDSSLGMLDQAKKNGVYKNYIHATVDKLGSIPVNNETYDILLMSNGFAPGQVYPDCLPELMRVLRHGGYLIWTMKDGFQVTSPRFAMMDNEINDLVKQGTANLIIGPLIFQKYIQDCPGRFYMLQKALPSQWATGSPNSSPRFRRRNSWVTTTK